MQHFDFVPGSQFNEFVKWVEWDNNTAIYYETWTVWEKPGTRYKLHFSKT